jgi:hypothetical protein
MNSRILTLSLLSAAAACAGDLAPGDALAAPVRIEAGGAPISLNTASGHAGPLVVDWDGDGRRDLLVGQFGPGQLRIYRNSADGAPVLGAPEWFQVDGKPGSVPTG